MSKNKKPATRVIDLKPSAYNPRKISQRQREALGRAMAEFGDLGGIVLNIRTGSLVGGHMRLKHLDPKWPIEKRASTDATGTVAVGHIQTPWGEFSYREVDWPERKEKKANIAANHHGGEDDDPALAKLIGDLEKDGAVDFDLLGLTEDSEVEAILASLQEIENKEEEAGPDDAPPPPEKPIAKRGDLWKLGNHRVLCGSATDAADMEVLLGGYKADMVFTDPPYGVSYKARSGKFEVIEGDDARDDSLVNDLLAPAFKLMVANTAPGAGFYIWHASSTRDDFVVAMKAAGLLERQYLIWAKLGPVLGHSDYRWSHEPCQPAGTMVSMPGIKKPGRGRPQEVIRVPIEELRTGDKVVSFNLNQGKVEPRGKKIKTTKRQYSGKLFSITADKKTTKTTAEHRFSVRFSAKKDGCQAVYLMRKGNWWRLGHVSLFNSRGFGLASRLNDEKGDDAWILKVEPSRKSARITEHVLMCKYGIPTTHWEPDRYCPKPKSQRTKKEIKQIYDQIGFSRIGEGAIQILKEYGRMVEYPMLQRKKTGMFSRKTARMVRACNLFPEIMEVPIPSEGPRFYWSPISDIQSEKFSGEVYSMDVVGDHHYIADGIITHNCFYAAKDDGPLKFYGDRTHETVWRAAMRRSGEMTFLLSKGVVLLDGKGGQVLITKKIPKGKKFRKVRAHEGESILIHSESKAGTLWEVGRTGNMEHPTQKPVELARRAIENSSQVGEIVLDPFMGSGTTVIGAEVTGRRAYGTELDPRYVDVVISRWERFCGKKAELVGEKTQKEQDNDKETVGM